MHHTDDVGHEKSHPLVWYVVAVGRYVHDAGNVSVVIIGLLEEGTGQAGEPMPGCLFTC